MTELILCIISNLFIVSFVCISFYFLSTMRRDMRRFKSLMIQMNAMLFGLKIKQDLEGLNNLQHHLQQCVDSEDFENAKKLKKVIEEQTEHLTEQLSMFKKMYGDICDINVDIVKMR